jgi:hypothetical protein
MDEFDVRSSSGQLSADGMSLIRGDIKVEWCDIGEGLDGDYNPTNPKDVLLLRFYVSQRDIDGVWADVQDGSYCTLMPVGTDSAYLAWGLQAIMAAAEQPSPKHELEAMSWMTPAWADRDGAYVPQNAAAAYDASAQTGKQTLDRYGNLHSATRHTGLHTITFTAVELDELEQLLIDRVYGTDNPPKFLVDLLFRLENL